MLKALSRNAFAIKGPKHSQGGVPLGGVEVEGGETVHFTRPGAKGYVFSDAFGYAGKTFAQHHKELAKRNASPIEIAKLAQTQERNRPMIQKNKKYNLGGLLSTAARIGGSALPYAGPALTFGMGLFSKDRTPKATKVNRTALNDLRRMETDINVDPALEQGSNAYRAFQQSSGSNPSVALAGYTANLRNRSGLMAGREAARTELVNKRQGAMAEANMNYDNQDAQYAEQARQDRMQSQAARTNFLTEGLTGMSGAYTNDMNNAVGLSAIMASMQNPKELVTALQGAGLSGRSGKLVRGMYPQTPTKNTILSNAQDVVSKLFNTNSDKKKKLGGTLDDPTRPMGYADSQLAAQQAQQMLAEKRTANTMNTNGFRLTLNSTSADISDMITRRGLPKINNVINTPRKTEQTPVKFGEAFAQARRQNLPTFEWNGRKYTTQLAGTASSSSKTKSAQPTSVTPAQPTSVTPVTNVANRSRRLTAEDLGLGPEAAIMNRMRRMPEMTVVANPTYSGTRRPMTGRSPRSDYKMDNNFRRAIHNSMTSEEKSILNNLYGQGRQPNDKSNAYVLQLANKYFPKR